MRAGSFCTGYGGLDLALAEVYDVRHAWHAEIDPDASKVLVAHWPDVPNHGDLRATDWSSVEPVDVLTAGFPCQPVSAAGRRQGLDDERWLFDDIADAVGGMDPRPRMLVFENVRGLLTANRGHAMARVVHRLAALGYVGRYRTVRASDVGAAHRRERVFIVAWPADCPPDAGQLAGRVGVGAAGVDGVTLLPTPRASDTGTPGRRASEGFRPPLSEVLLTKLLPTPTSRDHKGHNQRGDDTCLTGALLPTPNAALGRGTGTPSAETATQRRAEGRRFLDDAVALLPTPRATDGTKGGPNQRGSSGDLMLPSAVVQLLPTPTVADSRGTRNATATRSTVKPTTNSDAWTLSDVAYAGRWGNYGPAVARWEQVTGRPAPDPTEPGTKGQPRLASEFVEWLMGLPAGWVTDQLPRNAALRVLGNGVVPQQAARAIADLVGVTS